MGLGISLAVCLGPITAFLVFRALRRRGKQTLEQGNGIAVEDGIGAVKDKSKILLNGPRQVVWIPDSSYLDSSGELSE